MVVGKDEHGVAGERLLLDLAQRDQRIRHAVETVEQEPARTGGGGRCGIVADHRYARSLECGDAEAPEIGTVVGEPGVHAEDVGTGERGGLGEKIGKTVSILRAKDHERAGWEAAGAHRELAGREAEPHIALLQPRGGAGGAVAVPWDQEGDTAPPASRRGR